MTRSGVRLPISFSLAACTTVALFWFLGVLVSVDPTRTWIPVTRDIDIVRVPVPEPDPIRIPPVRPPIVKPQLPPEVPTVTVDSKLVIPGNDPSKFLPPGVGTGEGEIHPPTGDEVGPGTNSGSDRGAMPQVRIEPDYPQQAKARGIEGWVRFRFTVATDGSVKDIVIIDAEPRRVFDAATIRAVANWKYQPAIKDGKPVEQVGVTVTYRFELER